MKFSEVLKELKVTHAEVKLAINDAEELIAELMEAMRSEDLYAIEENITDLNKAFAKIRSLL